MHDRAAPFCLRTEWWGWENFGKPGHKENSAARLCKNEISPVSEISRLLVEREGSRAERRADILSLPNGVRGAKLSPEAATVRCDADEAATRSLLG